MVKNGETFDKVAELSILSIMRNFSSGDKIVIVFDLSKFMVSLGSPLWSGGIDCASTYSLSTFPIFFCKQIGTNNS